MFDWSLTFCVINICFFCGLGCDRTLYENKRQKLEENHQSKIAAVVDEWDEAELRYKKLKNTNLALAQEKMRSVYRPFRIYVIF